MSTVVATEGVDAAEASEEASIVGLIVGMVAAVEAVSRLGFNVEVDVEAQMFLHPRVVFWALRRRILRRNLQGSIYGSRM